MTFEYRTERVRRGAVTEQLLNDFGADRWQLVSVVESVPGPYEDHPMLKLVFMRRVVALANREEEE